MTLQRREWEARESGTQYWALYGRVGVLVYQHNLAEPVHADLQYHGTRSPVPHDRLAPGCPYLEGPCYLDTDGPAGYELMARYVETSDDRHIWADLESRYSNWMERAR